MIEPTAAVTAQNASRTLPLLLERGIGKALVVCAPLHLHRARFFFSRLYGPHGIETIFHRAPVAPAPRAGLGAGSGCGQPAATPRCASRALAAERAVSDTVVFIPAWNEEQNLPGCWTTFVASSRT